MKLTPKILKAINFASKKHKKGVRKGDKDLPYISHCFATAWILNSFTKDEDVIVAGLLHDVIEDVLGPKGYKILQEKFGQRVVDIVKGVTEDKDPNKKEKEKPWIERKQDYLAHLKKDSKESMMVSAADKIHNLQSMRDAYCEQGEKLWKHFNATKEESLWFYEQVYKIVRGKLRNKIVGELGKQLAGAKKEFK
jgi:(p)ppGpp synthase/HD superfamily hydrolase